MEMLLTVMIENFWRPFRECTNGESLQFNRLVRERSFVKRGIELMLVSLGRVNLYSERFSISVDTACSTRLCNMRCFMCEHFRKSCRAHEYR